MRAACFAAIAFVLAGCSTRTQAPGELRPAGLAGPSRVRPDTQVIRVRYRVGTTDSIREVVRRIVVHKEAVDLSPTRPNGWPRNLPWRPLRHFGPFQEGSDLEQIQVVVDRGGNGWYYNGYFASFTPDEVATAEPVYRIYHRRDYFNDAPADATLPTGATPPLNHIPGAGRPGMSNGDLERTYPFGFVNQMLFSLSSVSWSSRFGGSAVLEFHQADFAGPNEPRVSHDDFEYELLRQVGSDEYRFDLDDVTMRVYVNPEAMKFNPKANFTMTMPTFVEFTAGETIAYKNRIVVPPSSVDAMLRESLDSAASKLARDLGQTGNRPPAPVFVLSFIHNQFQSLIAVNDKVTRLYIADDWLDVITQQYQPYVFMSLAVDEVFMETSDWEGEPEIRVKIKGFQTMQGGGEQRISSETDEIGRNQSTGWARIAAFSVAECALIDHFRVKIVISEIDPLSPDDDVGTRSLSFILNCDAVQAQAAQQYYTGWVADGLLPAANGTLLDCDHRDEFTNPDNQIDPDLGCRSGAELHGRIVFGSTEDPSCFDSNSGDTTCRFPLDVVVPWRARLGIGAR